MDTANTRFRGWTSFLHIGGHSFPAILLLTVCASVLSVLTLPSLYFVFGRGWVAPLLLGTVMALVALVLLRIFFFHLYGSVKGEGDAALLEYFVQQNAMGPQEEEVSVELLENALQLKQVRVKDCMSPRPEIVHIDVSESIENLRKVFIESSLSRILVTEGDVDQVLGYVHIQQLFSEPATIGSMIMPIVFVPETLPVDEMMQKFIQSRRSMACVVDEYGSIAGIVTLEDALEQLFGEIDDEHDQEEFIEVVVSEHEYLFSGRLRIDYLNDHYPELQLPEGDYHTLSGYVLAGAGIIPQQGARLMLDGKTFVLELVSDRKIETVRIIC
ncbi:MAG: transporter associated domain-containing protein [Saprospiraceae bacterium]|nr:transporter associated domain-containing protein [Saprospiraceae bacterium]